MTEPAQGSTQVRVYNTMTQRVESLAPTHPGELRMYVCGPTAYDVPHAGHARSAVAFDVLVRHLRASGMKVTYARNITDIDDKILARSRELGEDPLALSTRMTRIYQDDLQQLSCVEPDHQPKVSEHLDDVVRLIQAILECGKGYVVDMPSGAKDVYFSVREAEGYGKLSKRNIDELEVGARVEKGENKRDPLDFALWKGSPDEAYGWPSPWGKGRPGWHIECSAMSERYLGFGFDIHGGGMDLIFPHHENEIAQSEAAHAGQGPFARVWMHNGFVQVDKEKMSKSLGNFVTIRDVLERNDPEAFRYFLMTVHYRGPLTFDSEKLGDGRVVFPGVDEAERRVDYLYVTTERIEALVGTGGQVGKLPKELEPIERVVSEVPSKLRAALNDDLNTPVALAVVGELAKAANDLCDLGAKRSKDRAFQAGASALAARALEALRSCSEVLGLLRADPKQYAERTRKQRMALRALDARAIEESLAARAEARASKEFARADAIRAELLAKGVEIADTPHGTVWRVGV